jgi:hypothetical protein
MRQWRTSRARVLTLVDSRQLSGIVVACGLLGFSGGVSAGDDSLPDVEFLEYLGSWDESDEDWLLISDVEKAREELTKDERRDPGLQGEESTETENEG